jgi:hypothetical protein
MKLSNSSFFYALFFIFSIHLLQAQPNNKYLSGSAVPAPNAGALGKYGDIPVSYFTGVPDISIPIHTVTEGPVSLPIALNYHASGIKVSEMASWVGMGWSLNAGGIITRTVQGIPDENLPFGYYTYGNQAPGPSSGPTFGNYIADCGSGTADSEPDLFTFNVGGFSGKFYIDHKDAISQGKPAYQFVPRQDLKLEFNTDFTRFTIIATDGTRYTFGQAVINTVTVNAREYTQQFGQPASSKYCSSWYLLLVESPDLKHSINLTYTDEYYGYWNLSACSYVARNEVCTYPSTNALAYDSNYSPPFTQTPPQAPETPMICQP